MNYLKSILFELTLIFWFEPLNFLGLLVKPRNKLEKDSKKTIVFVPGWGATSLPFIFFKRYFERRGFNVFLFDSGFSLGSIDNLSLKLKKFVDENDLDGFCLVGGSLGGLTCLNYAIEFGGFEKIRKLVTVGTPIRGTWVAYFAYPFSSSARHISPGSKFLKRFESLQKEDLEKIVCIRAKFDELVSGKSAQILGAENLELDLVGHGSVHFLAKTYETILKML